MARPIKTGLSYFPLDVDFFEDDKTLLVQSEFGDAGLVITMRLFCKIYNNGYYYPWGETESMLFATKNGIKHNILEEVVKCLLRRKLFDQDIYAKYSVLTSRGIQRRYIEAKLRSKDVQLIKEYLLIDVSEFSNRINVSINSINVNNNSQSKVDNIKEKEKREEFSPPLFDDVLNFFVEKAGWELKKAGDEADKFINHYAGVGWVVKGVPIVNWRNVAAGWISKDGEFGANGKSHEKQNNGFPDYFDKTLFDKLFNSTPQKHGPYVAHLQAMGWRWTSNNGTLIKMVKMESDQAQAGASVVPIRAGSSSEKPLIENTIGKKQAN